MYGGGDEGWLGAAICIPRQYLHAHYCQCEHDESGPAPCRDSSPRLMNRTGGGVLPTPFPLRTPPPPPLSRGVAPQRFLPVDEQINPVIISQRCVSTGQIGAALQPGLYLHVVDLSYISLDCVYIYMQYYRKSNYLTGKGECLSETLIQF